MDAQFWLMLVFPAFIGVLYYVCCHGSPARRLGAASPSIALLCAFAYAVAVSPWSGSDPSAFLWLFWAMLGLYVACIGLAVALYRGEPAIHGLQVFQALNAAMIWIIGTITITHDGP
jgi:hypothetical protein